MPLVKQEEDIARKGIARIMAASVVDTRDYDAVDVGQVPVAGEISGAHFVHVETDEDHVSRNFPINIPLGDHIYCDVSGKNTGTAPQWMRCTVELYDPDGILRGTNEAHGDVNPGTSMSSGITPHVTLDKEGTWIIRGILEAEPA